MLPIVGITGLKGSGKDTAGAYLAQKYGFHRQSFADALKREVAQAVLAAGNINFDLDMLLWYIEEHKRHPLNHPQGWPRQILQAWGIMQRDVRGSDYWIKQIDFAPGLVICDVRFPNEAEALKAHGGILLRINRVLKPKPQQNGYFSWLNYVYDWMFGRDNTEVDLHSSESQIMDLDANWEIDNNETPEDMYRQLDAVVQHYVLYPQYQPGKAAA